MKYVFCPVSSRRLGQSLGIDPIPQKTCNWNCVYCQLGRSTPMTNTRREYISCEAILEEVTQALQTHFLSPAQGKFDFRNCESVDEAILSVITRHSMREDDLFVSLHHWSVEDVHQMLQNLSESGQAQLITRYGVHFWAAAETKYAN